MPRARAVAEQRARHSSDERVERSCLRLLLGIGVADKRREDALQSDDQQVTGTFEERPTVTYWVTIGWRSSPELLGTQTTGSLNDSSTVTGQARNRGACRLHPSGSTCHSLCHPSIRPVLSRHRENRVHAPPTRRRFHPARSVRRPHHLRAACHCRVHRTADPRLSLPPGDRRPNLLRRVPGPAE